MKKLNYSWKVAGFALLFGLSMGLQSCDQVIDNPLSPVQPVPETPATPATPKASVKGSVITIENCADTKDVNTLLSSDDVKKVFAQTATVDSLGNVTGDKVGQTYVRVEIRDFSGKLISLQ